MPGKPDPIDWGDMLDRIPEKHGRMNVAAGGGAPRQEEVVKVASEVLNAGATATAIKPMTRRTGGVGAFGVYMEGRQADGTVLRGFLAANVFGTSTLAPGAKGARWVLDQRADAEAAQEHARQFFGDVETSAVLVELTGQDVSRLQRSVLTSAVYPLQDLLSVTADDMWAEEG